MVDRTETVGVRLTPKERADFEEYIEDNNECNSLSQFFRLAAYNFKKTDEQDVSIDPDEIVEAVDIGVSPIAEQLDELEEHILSIDSQVNNDDKIDKLARDIYSVLPTHESGSDLPEIRDSSELNDASDFVIAQKISTPYLWSEYFDEDVADVRRACSRMQEYYPDVKYVSEDLKWDDGKNVPSHEDMEYNTPSKHTDFTYNKQSSGSSSTTTSSSQGSRTERRYYKTSD
ncbi:hypothetical protein BRD20_08865 [Halobacteriales archaeon SW_8_65_20]|nr:MAG: hypothetical protein BRD20_08865 [Halobacteriales archaeon SW_8_65_20]